MPMLADLPAASALGGTELLYAQQPATTAPVKVTAAQLADYVLEKNDNIAAFGALTGAANKLAYFTGAGALALLELDADTTLAANSDGRIATQKATKAYVDGLIAAATYTDEQARDAVAAALVEGSGIDITVNDGANTITLAVDDAALKPTESLIVAIGDETTAITTGTAKVTFRMPYAFTLTGVRGNLKTAQTSGSIITFDINEGGTSILSTKLTIDNTEKTSTTAATAPVISDASLADDAEITIDVDQVGDGTAKGGKIVLIGRRT